MYLCIMTLRVMSAMLIIKHFSDFTVQMAATMRKPQSKVLSHRS